MLVEEINLDEARTATDLLVEGRGRVEAAAGYLFRASVGDELLVRIHRRSSRRI